MPHVTVLLWAVAFGVGIMATASISVRYRHERFGLLRRYSRFLLLSNLAVGAVLATTYVVTNVADLRSLAAERWTAVLFLITSFWLVAAFMHELVLMTLDLIGHDLPARLRRRLVLVLALAPVLLLAGLVLVTRDISSDQTFGYSEILNVSVVVCGMVAILGSLAATRHLVHASYRRAVRWFCSLHLMAFSLIVVAAVASPAGAWSALTASFLIVNLTPLTVLGSLLAHYRASKTVGAEREGGLGAFAERYGISPREREIVRLLLGGCTNDEIGNRLCISSHTVKNHLYSVYRKADVRNRVQLANLVRSP